MPAAGRRHSRARGIRPRRGGPGLRRSPRFRRAPLPPTPLRAGDEVEVRLDGDGFFGTWYEATVVGPAPARGSRPGARYVVAYTHIAASSGGGGSLATEVFAPTHIRPRPPPGPSPPRFRLHDFVEALDRGGWWSGIVVAGDAADPAGGGSVTVAFPITREVMSFAPHLVRRRRDYIGGGDWVPSRAVLDEEAQSNGALMVYKVGDKVDVWRIRDVYGYSWFVATVTKVIDRFSYIVEYSEQEDEEMATEYLYWQCIRPAMDCSPQDREFQPVPGAVVEAYCDGAWSPGVMHRVLGEDEYEVCLGRGKARQMVTKVVELLKPHYRWDGNCWTTAKPKRKANLRLQSGSGKRPSSPEYSDTKKSRKELQRQEVILAGGSEHVLVPETENPLSASHKSPASNHFSNSCSPLPGHSPPPIESITNVDDDTINEEFLSTMVFLENNVGKVHPIQALQGKKDASNDVQIQLKKNKSCSKEINAALSASVECQTSSVLTRQVSTRTNGGSKMNVYARKLKMMEGLKGPGTPQSSLDVKSAVRKGERKKVAECKKHSSLILERTEFQTQRQLGRTMEDTLNLNEVTNQKLPPMVTSGFELYNKKGVDTHSNLLDKGLTTTFSSICQVIRNEDVPTGNHVIETPTLYSNQLVQQDQGNVNEKSIMFGLQNAGNSQCSTDNNILRSSSIAGRSMPSQLAVSQITDDQVVFVKNSFLWAEFEKMDVFKKVSQQPHFRPLMGQSPALREATALGLMATFADSVENIRKLSLADSTASFEDNCRTLCMLKENGFNVQCLQNYLNRLVQIKTNNTRHLEHSSNLKADILEATNSLAKFDLFLDEEGKAIAELEKNLSEHHHEVQKIAKEKEHKDAELSRLKAADSNLEEACGDDEQQFRSVLAELQRKRLT